MQQTALHNGQARRWTHDKALERRFGQLRGMLLTNAAHGESTGKRVLSAARLDGAMVDQLAGMLAVSVRDWLRR
jgi:hypothetical protein